MSFCLVWVGFCLAVVVHRLFNCCTEHWQYVLSWCRLFCMGCKRKILHSWGVEAQMETGHPPDLWCSGLIAQWPEQRYFGLNYLSSFQVSLVFGLVSGLSTKHRRDSKMPDGAYWGGSNLLPLETLQQVVGCKIGLVSWCRPATSAASRWVWDLLGTSASTRGRTKPWSWVFAVPWLVIVVLHFSCLTCDYCFTFFLWFCFNLPSEALTGGTGPGWLAVLWLSSWGLTCTCQLCVGTLSDWIDLSVSFGLTLTVTLWLELSNWNCQLPLVGLGITLAVTLIVYFPLIVFHPVQLVGQTML